MASVIEESGYKECGRGRSWRSAPILTRCERSSAMMMRKIDSNRRRILLKRDCVANNVRCVGWRKKEVVRQPARMHQKQQA